MRINTREIFEKYKISPNVKLMWLFHYARWFPCRLWGMLSRLISWRWSRPFTWDIWKGTWFFISLRQAKRVRSKMFLYTVEHGMNIGWLRMSNLKRCCGKTQTLCASPTRCFFVWDRNHHIQAWMPYSSRLHSNDSSWHIFANFILLDTFEGLVELLTTMINLNK